MYKCIALSKSSGFCGTKSEEPLTTLNEPSLSKNILSILFKKNSWSVVTSEPNFGISITEAPEPLNCLSCPSPALIDEASSTLGLKSKLSLSSKVSPVVSDS